MTGAYDDYRMRELTWPLIPLMTTFVTMLRSIQVVDQLAKLEGGECLVCYVIGFLLLLFLLRLNILFEPKLCEVFIDLHFYVKLSCCGICGGLN